MTVIYKVWVEIERINEEKDEYTTMDTPGAELREFKSYKKAYEFAQRVTDMAEGI